MTGKRSRPSASGRTKADARRFFGNPSRRTPSSARSPRCHKTRTPDPRITAPRGSRFSRPTRLRCAARSSKPGEWGMTSFAGAAGNYQRDSQITSVWRGTRLAAPLVPTDTGDVLQALRVACASSLSSLAVCDQFGHILLASHPIAMVFGYERDELVKCHFGALVPDVAAGGWTEGVSEVSGVRKNGSPVPVKVSIATVPGREALFVASVVDLTDERRLESQAVTDREPRAVPGADVGLRDPACGGSGRSRRWHPPRCHRSSGRRACRRPVRGVFALRRRWLADDGGIGMGKAWLCASG